MTTIGIITVSDRSSRGERKDLSGPEIRNWALYNDYEVLAQEIIEDEKELIKKTIIDLSNRGCNLILTTGGTGFAPRDVTPEATKEIIEKEAPGFAEAMRIKSLAITPHAMLSRAVSGIRKNSLIINLPGSPKAVRENLAFIENSIPHAIELLNNNVDSCGSD